MNTYRLSDQQRQLVEQNLGLVKYSIIHKYGISLLADEDLLQCGYLGLCQAASQFDPNRGVSFATFAYSCICNAVYIYLSHTQESLAAKYNVQLTSLNSRVIIDGDSYGEVVDYVADPRVNVENMALNRVICDRIGRPSKLYKQHFVDGYTFDQMSKINGSRNRQVEHRRLKDELLSMRKKLIGMGVTSKC